MPLQELLPDGLDLSNALGTITLVTIPDAPATLDTFRDAWQAEPELLDKFLPQRNSATDAFRNACRSVETRRASNGSTKLIEIKVDEVLNEDAECIYQVTRMVRDKDRKEIEHPKAMRLTFDKLGQRTGVNSDPITADLYEHIHEDALRKLAESVRDQYVANLTTTPGARVRAAVRNTLLEIRAIKLRGASGGAYFVKRDQYPVVEALERVLAKLYDGTDAHADLDSYAMPNVAKSRVQIEKHHTTDTRAGAGDLMARIAEKLKSGEPLEPRFVQDALAARADLGAQRQDVEALIGRQTAAVDEVMAMLDRQVETLMNRPQKQSKQRAKATA